MSAILVDKTIIGNVLVLRTDPEHGIVYYSKENFVSDGRIQIPERRQHDMSYTYVECRIRKYDSLTRELVLDVQSVCNGPKWYDLWQRYNEDWASLLKVNYIFLE